MLHLLFVCKFHHNFWSMQTSYKDFDQDNHFLCPHAFTEFTAKTTTSDNKHIGKNASTANNAFWIECCKCNGKYIKWLLNNKITNKRPVIKSFSDRPCFFVSKRLVCLKIVVYLQVVRFNVSVCHTTMSLTTQSHIESRFIWRSARSWDGHINRCFWLLRPRKMSANLTQYRDTVANQIIHFSLYVISILEKIT